MKHKRITERRIAKGDTASAAIAIAGEARVGMIDGVSIDFRHDELSPDDWEPLPQWYVAGPPGVHAGIMFPNQAAALDRDPTDNGRVVRLVEARAGDKITVQTVVPHTEGRRFDHPHDSEHRLAYLRLERPSGEVLTGIGPLAFFGTTMIREAPTREAFDHVLARLCLHTGKGLNDNPVEVMGMVWDLPLDELGRRFGAEAHDAYFELLKLFSGDLRTDGQSRAHLRLLANKSVLAGFLLGKFEARRAEKAAAGTANQPKAAQGRRDMATLRAADEAWNKKPRATAYAIAKQVCGTRDPSSVAKSIMHLAPDTSPSHPKKRPARQT